ncbi:XRE family transcriptional regulator [Rhizobium phaseoli]|uniref:XRE family transcriptional regulator n=1 Tax=Rhizobium phaseoli TaxID=396 RepID=UPI000F863F63|nr:XRE family transcriptional regulator [Rhizobium phaseoli]RUM16835.1 XRE family transcriptional regulator [Rhizobium phaseoli]
MPAVSPDALRAARGLACLSERDVERLTGISSQALEASEAGKPGAARTSVRLGEFYAALGIELLGWVSLTTGYEYGAGARWRPPWEPGRMEAEAAARRNDPPWLAFAAARAMLEWDQKTAADKAGLSRRQVEHLEAEGPSTRKSRERLRIMYESRGIEFLGALANGRVVGVGVRRSSVTDPIFWADILRRDGGRTYPD